MTGERLHRRDALALILAGAGLASACSRRSSEAISPITTFAAVSLTDVLNEIADTFKPETGQRVRLSFAGSGSVARQIMAGASADVVVLAEPKWMDELQSRNLIQPSSRLDLLSNELVLIAPADSAVRETDLAQALSSMVASGGRLAIGDPESVPVGTYARQMLTQTGQWQAVENHLVTASDVRAVRTFVARGEAALGIVYVTDTVGAGDVRIVARLPQAIQPDILYPAALTANALAGAVLWLDYLSGPTARAVFDRAGFITP